MDVSPWMSTSDIGLRELAGMDVDLDEAFHSVVEGKDYFIVTQFDELERQPDLKQTLGY